MRAIPLVLVLILTGLALASPTEDELTRGSNRCWKRVVNLPGATNGDDVLIGRIGRDVIQGRKGADGLFGLSGADRLCGGKGQDNLVGGDGYDRLNGGRGYDICRDGERVRKCEQF